MRDEYLPVVLANSRYAQRLPIGTKEILEDFDYETLRQFYQDWYRPDLMAVVAVGEINVDSMEAQIKQYFGELTNPEQPRERTAYDIPNHDDTKVVVVTDPEATFNQLSLYYKADEAPEEEETLRDYRQSVLGKHLHRYAQRPPGRTYPVGRPALYQRGHLLWRHRAG